MSKEIGMITRSMLYTIGKAKSVHQAFYDVQAGMDEEDVAVVCEKLRKIGVDVDELLGETTKNLSSQSENVVVARDFFAE